MKKYIFTILIGLLTNLSLLAEPVEMADKMRAEGKIYMVVAVMLTIFIGIAFYLFNIDRRVKKLEKND